VLRSWVQADVDGLNDQKSLSSTPLLTPVAIYARLLCTKPPPASFYCRRILRFRSRCPRSDHIRKNPFRNCRQIQCRHTLIKKSKGHGIIAWQPGKAAFCTHVLAIGSNDHVSASMFSPSYPVVINPFPAASNATAEFLGEPPKSAFWYQKSEAALYPQYRPTYCCRHTPYRYSPYR